MAMRIFC